jgi:hypothetical protein
MGQNCSVSLTLTRQLTQALSLSSFLSFEFRPFLFVIHYNLMSNDAEDRMLHTVMFYFHSQLVNLQ